MAHNDRNGPRRRHEKPLRAPRPTMRAGCVAVIAMPLLFATTTGAFAQSDPFSNSPTGMLTVEVEVSGQGRHTSPNKVEWHELNVSRRLQLQLPMVRVGTAPVGFAASPRTRAAQAAQANAQPPAGFAEMEREMQACGEDQQCLMQKGMKFGRLMQEGKIEKPAGPPMAEKDRFHHWAVDRRKTCATGVIAIDDKGHGVEISPPRPSAPFNYRRSGERKLPADLAPVIDKVCSAMIAIDTTGRSLDIAIPGFTVPVKLSYSGSGAFTGETGTSSIFVEGTKHGAQVGAVDLFDFPIDPAARQMSGKRQVDRIGQVTHAGGYGVTPVRATVTWSFVRN
jgi:hypothetical protein